MHNRNHNAMARLLPLLALGALSAACGGGGNGSGNGGNVQPVNTPPTVSAGTDQRVAENSLVQLSGTASDADGDPLTYSWSQVSGVAVTLSSTTNAQTSFTAPAVAAGSTESLVFRLTVNDGSGGSTSDDVLVTVEEAVAFITLSGIAEYEMAQRNTNCAGLNLTTPMRRPIRGATVDIVRASDQSVIASTVTNDNGFYSVNVDGNTDVFVRVRSELRRGGSPGWDVEVRNNTLSTNLPLTQRPKYFLDSSTFNTGNADTTRDLLAGNGWTGTSFGGTRAAAPFAVLDVIYEMMQFVLLEGDPAVSFPPLDAFWSPDNRTTPGSGNLLDDIDAGNLGLSFYVGGSIGSLFILGEDGVDIDEFDTHVIAHEWGHYFEDRFSRSDSLGGPHTFGDALDPRLAFGEGFGQAIAGIGMDEPVYCDALWFQGALNGFGFNLEDIATQPPTQPLGTRGWFNEFSVAMLLYDLWDVDVDGVDTSSIGFGPMYDVLLDEQRLTPALTSAFSFFAALKAQPGVPGAFVDALLARENIEAAGIDAFATGETNSANATPPTDVLPVYTTIVANVTQQVCVTTQFNVGRIGNYLSNSRFLRLDLAQAGPVTITVDTVNPPTTPSPTYDCTDPTDPELHTHSDPDIELWRSGQSLLPTFPVRVGESCEANQEIATTPTLSAGTYIIEVLEFRHDDPDTDNPGNFAQVCFDITVTP